MNRAYPLDWPEGWPRTPAHQRRSSSFKVSFARARGHLLSGVRLLGGRDPILSTDVALRRDGLPYANVAAPDDPGAAVHFTWRERPYVLACDRFRTVGENLRAIGLTIESLRALRRYGATDLLERAFSGFAALPSPDALDWRAELGFSPHDRVDANAVAMRYRALSMKAHPDAGWSEAAMVRLNRARDLALKEFTE
jgi:hypothetical protein